MIPCRVEHDLPGKPIANWVIIVLNFVAFMLCPQFAIDSGEFELFLKTYGLLADNPVPSTFLTSMFMHGSWLHLIGNMIFLFVYGNVVNKALGNFFYFVTYLAVGLVAGFGHIIFTDGDILALGASGAVMGVAGMFLALRGKDKVQVAFPVPFPPFLIPLFFIPAWIVLMFSVGGDIMGIILTPAEYMSIGHWVHLLGFGGGFAFMVWLLAGNFIYRTEWDICSLFGMELPTDEEMEEGGKLVDDVMRGDVAERAYTPAPVVTQTVTPPPIAQAPPVTPPPPAAPVALPPVAPVVVVPPVQATPPASSSVPPPAPVPVVPAAQSVSPDLYASPLGPDAVLVPHSHDERGRSIANIVRFADAKDIGSLEISVAAYEQDFPLRPLEEALYQRIVELYYQAKQYNDALNMCQRILKYYPNSSRVAYIHYIMGLLYVNALDSRFQGRKHLELCVKLSTDQAVIKQAQDMINKMTVETKQASAPKNTDVDQYAGAMDHNIGFADHEILQAQVLDALEQDNEQELVKTYLEFRRHHPKMVLPEVVYQRLANIYYATKHYKGAIGICQQLLKSYPESDRTLHTHYIAGLLYAKFLSQPYESKKHLHACLVPSAPAELQAQAKQLLDSLD